LVILCFFLSYWFYKPLNEGPEQLDESLIELNDKKKGDNNENVEVGSPVSESPPESPTIKEDTNLIGQESSI
jgi:hypothetical protein